MAYMVVERAVTSDDGDTADAQPQGGVEALHQRHHLHNHAAAHKALHRLLYPEHHSPLRPADSHREHGDAGVPVPRAHDVPARHTLGEDAEQRAGRGVDGALEVVAVVGPLFLGDGGEVAGEEGVVRGDAGGGGGPGVGGAAGLGVAAVLLGAREVGGLDREGVGGVGGGLGDGEDGGGLRRR